MLCVAKDLDFENEECVMIFDEISVSASGTVSVLVRMNGDGL